MNTTKPLISLKNKQTMITLDKNDQEKLKGGDIWIDDHIMQ